MNLISKIVEPSRVQVIWQAPDKELRLHTGIRYVVGEITVSNGVAKLHYFDDEEVKAAIASGFTGLTAYPYDPKKEYNGNLLEVLAKRLPPEDRTDYGDFLLSYRLPKGTSGISSLALLAYTSGKLAGDGFTFVHTFEGAEPPFEFTFEIAGFRHTGLKSFPDFKVLQDAEVTFRNDTNNEYDHAAVAIDYQGKLVGFVPKGINQTLRDLIAKHKVTANIEKINGTLMRPNIMVFVKVS